MAVAEAPPADQGAGTDALRRNIEAHVSGNVSGQLAIGDRNIQVSAAEGAVVIVGGAPPAAPRRRPSPVQLGPRDFPGLLGRDAELAGAGAAVSGSRTLEIHAGPGWGKSALLRRLCHAVPVPADGVVYLPGGGLQAGDVEQLLFDAFYESAIPVKPSPLEVRRLLAGVSALIVLDDSELDRQMVERVLDAAPQCAVVVAASEAVLAGEAASLALAGLGEDAGVALFERELGRGLAGRDLEAARSIWRATGGQPLALVQAAALAREQPQPLAALARSLSNSPVDAQAASALGAADRRLLGLLAALDGRPLTTAALEAMLGPEAAESLARLERRGLAVRKGSGYAAPILGPAAVAELGPDASQPEAVRRVAGWAEAAAGSPAALLELAETLQHAVEMAQKLGLWSEVWRLVRVLAPALALAGRWGAWAAVLGAAMSAAQALGSDAIQAWCEHQLGVLHTGLGNLPSAAVHLRESQRLARRAGAPRTARLARENLRLIHPLHRLAIAAVAATVAAVGMGVAAWALPVPGQAGLQPESLAFGSVRVAAESAAQLEVVNRGYLSVGLRSVAAEGDFSVSGDCPLSPATLAGRASCTLTVSFRPTAVGDRQGTLVVTDAGGGQHVAGLSGRGIAPLLAVSPLRIDFGRTPVGRAGNPVVVSVGNQGEAALRLLAPVVSGDFKATSECPPLGQNLAPGAGCTLRVAFQPMATGTRSGELRLGDGAGQTATVLLTGFGTQGRAALTPSALDFGRQSVLLPSAPLAAVLSNTGDADLQLPPLVAVGDFAAVPKGCSQALPPGQRCAISVTFTPRSGGARTGTLSVAQSNGSSATIKLAGNGLYPSPTLSQKQSVVTVTNGGPGKLAITSTLTTGDSRFTVGSTTCNAPVDPKMSCQITYVASDTAQRTCAPTQLTVVDNAPDGKQSITICDSRVG